VCTYTVCASAAVEVRASADGEKLFEMKRTASELETGTEYAAKYHFENERLTMIHTDTGYYAPNETPGGGSGAG